jgi:hypothetical protein
MTPRSRTVDRCKQEVVANALANVVYHAQDYRRCLIIRRQRGERKGRFSVRELMRLHSEARETQLHIAEQRLRHRDVNTVDAARQSGFRHGDVLTGGHDKIGATAYANLDKKGTQQKIHISRKARIVPWIGFRTALWGPLD